MDIVIYSPGPIQTAKHDPQLEFQSVSHHYCDCCIVKKFFLLPNIVHNTPGGKTNSVKRKNKTLQSGNPPRSFAYFSVYPFVKFQIFFPFGTRYHLPGQSINEILHTSSLAQTHPWHHFSSFHLIQCSSLVHIFTMNGWQQDCVQYCVPWTWIMTCYYHPLLTRLAAATSRLFHYRLQGRKNFSTATDILCIVG